MRCFKIDSLLVQPLSLVCNTRLQPARRLCPWGFPGKNIGVGCYFLLQFFSFNRMGELLYMCLPFFSDKSAIVLTDVTLYISQFYLVAFKTFSLSSKLSSLTIMDISVDDFEYIPFGIHQMYGQFFQQIWKVWGQYPFIFFFFAVNFASLLASPLYLC